MIYIKYPQENLNNDQDLDTWLKTDIEQRNWRNLKNYINRHLREYWEKEDETQKCWYSEALIYDHYAEDVEHFRPKESAQPLNQTQKRKIRQIIGYDVPESDSSAAYPWLKFNHINYRIVTALTNRGGGKVESFPVLKNTNRLKEPELPGEVAEFPLLLDPCILHDASVLLVLPSGEIVPKAAAIHLSENQLADPATHWHDSAFDYLRGIVSIVVYQLNFPTLVKGRKATYEKVKEYMGRLERDVAQGSDNNIRDHINDIRDSISMYAPFALAGRCAVQSYIHSENVKAEVGNKTQDILTALYDSIVNKERQLL